MNIYQQLLTEGMLVKGRGDVLAERIRQARLAAGLTQDETIACLGGRITKAALSYYENGKRSPHASTLKALGGVFGVRTQWFWQEPSLEINWHGFRSLASLGKHQRERIKVMAQRQAEDYMEVWSLFPTREKIDFPPRHHVQTPEEADTLAANLRKRWMLGFDTIESVTQCLENHGVVIVHYDGIETPEFDGLSATINRQHPLLVVNNRVPVDRFRFDLLHELGHFMMASPKTLNREEEENLAHRFASSFLVPPQVLRNEIGTKRCSLTLSELLMIKENYGLSVAALIYSAKAHGIIDQALSRKLWTALSRRGWRKREPEVFTGNETPTKMRLMIMRAVTEGLMGVERALEMIPALKEQMASEGLLPQSRARELADLEPEERQRIMREAATCAAADYEAGGELSDALEHDGDVPCDYD